MTLDLAKTAGQLYAALPEMRDQWRGHTQALDVARDRIKDIDALDAEARRRQSKTSWRIACVENGVAGAFPPPPLPPDHLVVAVDGSHVDVDRHAAARCFLINIGVAALRYGEIPSADLRSEPTLRADDESLFLRDPYGVHEQAVEGALLGVHRTVAEIEALADEAERAPEGLPLLALLDGALVLWGLDGWPEFVRRELVDRRFKEAMDRLRAESARRPLAVASHISRPRSAEVMNAIRISRGVCGWEQVNCDANCGQRPRGERNCDVVAGVTDSALFARTLKPGERSQIFRSASGIAGIGEEPSDERGALFFYVNASEEVARVETPSWTSAEGIDLAHAALLAQTEKGHGYPLALQEAHEQAVVTGPDRRDFNHLLYETMSAERLPAPTSQKARSKRSRFV